MPPEGRIVLITPVAANTGLFRRLRSTNGHLQAIIAMVEAGEPCESVLHQLGAVQAALRCAGHSLIQCQLEQSAHSLLNSSFPKTRAQTVTSLSNLYSLFVKTQTYR